MNDQQSDTATEGPIHAIEQTESLREIREALAKARKHLKSIPGDGKPVDRARALLDVAELQLGLGRGGDAWIHAREAFSVFVDYEHWQDAVEAADILYQCDQPGSIAALGQGIWLAVTFPVDPELSVTMLNHVVEDTPEDSDGAAVAATTALFLIDVRAEGQQKENGFH